MPSDAGTVVFKEVLSMVCTMQRKRDGEFENKAFSFKVHGSTNGGTRDEDLVVIGKSELDMADYCDEEDSRQNRTLIMSFKAGSSSSSGSLKVTPGHIALMIHPPALSLLHFPGL